MSDTDPTGISRNTLATISRKVHARREWWAKRKQLSNAGAPVTMALNARPLKKTLQPALDNFGAAPVQGVNDDTRSGVGAMQSGAAPLSLPADLTGSDAANWGAARDAGMARQTLSLASHRASARGLEPSYATRVRGG